MLKAIRNLDYTVIFCQDVTAMKQFYHSQLGFPIYRKFDEWVELRVGASLLTLCKRGSGYDGISSQHGTAPIHAASLQLAFRVTPAEVESCFVELQQKGVAILQPPTDHASSGHRTLFFKDPENNILEIYADLV